MEPFSFISIITQFLIAIEKFLQLTKLTNVVRIFKFLFIFFVVLLCIVSLQNNSVYISFLKFQTKVHNSKVEKEIKIENQKLNTLYKEIGERVYNGRDTDDLINKVNETKQRIQDKQDIIDASLDNLKERIFFEATLIQLCSTKPGIRRAAIKKLAKVNPELSLPYLSMCLFDSDKTIYQEAVETIKDIIGNSPERNKLLVANFEQFQEVLQPDEFGQ